MNPDRLQIHVAGADPAAARRRCGCRGTGRGAHQAGCPERGRKAFRRHSHVRLAVLPGVAATALPALRRLLRVVGGERLAKEEIARAAR
jgi:hypothetical protein